MDEIFEYPFTKLDPVGGAHIDPPSVAVYESLLVKGPGDQPRAGLATSWSVSQDQLTWRLGLRPGARFHSGDPCDAAAVEAALERCRWGDGLDRQIWYWDPVDRVTVVDEATLDLRLYYPYARLPTLLWGTHTAICNARRRAEMGDRFGQAAADGTGAYRFVAYESDLVVAELSEAQGLAPARSPRAPRVLRWLSQPAQGEREAAVRDGQAQIVRAIAAGSLPASWRFFSQPEISQFYLALNFDDRLGFAELDLRRAIDALIDRDALVKVALDGQGDGRRSPVPAGDKFAAAYDPATVAPMPAAQAYSVLDQLGFERTGDGIRVRDGQEFLISCLTQDAEPFRRLAGELASQLRRAGIGIEFRYAEPFEEFYAGCDEHPQAIVSKWLWQDAIEAVMGFSRSDCAVEGGGNWQSARLPAVDATFDRYLQAAEPDLEAASRDVQEAFMRELPFIPLCSPAETYAVAGNVEGFTLVPGTLYPLYDQLGVTDA
jgi:peptide/nickel transport system substrate-binding protein